VRNVALINVNITSSNMNVGGIAGYNYGVIENCFVSGTINALNTAGGIAGRNDAPDGAIRNSYSAVAVTVTESGAGGIVGENNRIIFDNYATGAIKGAGSVGGIVGRASGGPSSDISGNVALNPSIERTSGTLTSFGRVIGTPAAGRVNSAFSGMQALGGISFGSGTTTNNNGGDLTAAQAKTQDTYSGAPRFWGFGTTNTNPWRWGLNAAYPLPTLHWQTTAPTLPAHLN